MKLLLTMLKTVMNKIFKKVETISTYRYVSIFHNLNIGKGQVHSVSITVAIGCSDFTYIFDGNVSTVLCRLIKICE